MRDVFMGWDLRLLMALAQGPVQVWVQEALLEESSVVAYALAGSAFLDQEVARRLASHEDDDVRWQLARVCQDPVVEGTLAVDHNEEVLWEVAGKTRSLDLIERFSTSSLLLALCVAGNPHISLPVAHALSVRLGANSVGSLHENPVVLENVSTGHEWSAAFLAKHFPDVLGVHAEESGDAVSALAPDWSGTIGDLCEAAKLVER